MAIFLVYYTLFCFQNSIDATLVLIRRLIVWSLLSIGFGLACDLLLAFFFEQSPYAIWILLGTLVMFGAAIIPRGPEARLGYTMALFVGVMGHLSHNPLAEALSRASVFMGALFLGIAISWILFPIKAHTIALQKILDGLHRQQELLQLIFHYMLKLDHNEALLKKWPEKPLLKHISEMRKNLIENQNMLHAMGNPSIQESMNFMLYSQARLLNYLVSFVRKAQVIRHNVLVQEYHHELFTLCLYANHGLKIWTLFLQKKAHDLLILPDCSSVHTQLHQKIKKMDLNSVPPENLTTFLSIYHELRSFALDIEEILSVLQISSSKIEVSNKGPQDFTLP